MDFNKDDISSLLDTGKSIDEIIAELTENLKEAEAKRKAAYEAELAAEAERERTDKLNDIAFDMVELFERYTEEFNPKLAEDVFGGLNAESKDTLAKTLRDTINFVLTLEVIKSNPAVSDSDSDVIDRWIRNFMSDI